MVGSNAGTASADDATAAAAYLSGQAQIFATNSLVAIDLAKKNQVNNKALLEKWFSSR